MRRFSFIMLCVAMFCQNVVARQLTAEEAFDNAMLQYSMKAPKAAIRTMSSVMTASQPTLSYTVETDDTPTVYVFTQKKGGYWIVAANDAVSNSLLGYTDTGVFDADNIPGNVEWVLNQYGKQVAHAASMENVAASDDDQEVSQYDVARNRKQIEPIITTKWGQTYPYNLYTPVVDGYQCPTGCVATAMAQVMYNFKYPVSGTGKNTVSLSGTKYTLNFDEVVFDWDAIDAAAGRANTSSSSDAISNLMYACGIATGMRYTPSASSSNYLTASRAMVKYFGYDNGMACLSRDFFTADEWSDIVYNELAEGRPVMYSGSSPAEGGHAFICDGYDGDNYFHVNWGWDGTYNGYFLLSVLDPKGNNAGFAYNESIIVGIQPARENSEVRPVVQFVSELTFDAASYTRTANGSVTFKDARGIFNQSVGAATFVFGARLVDADGNERFVESKSSLKLLAGQAFRTYTVPMSQFPTEGRWTVIPAVKTESGVWYDCFIKRDMEYAYVLDATESELKFTPLSEVKKNDLVDRDGVTVAEFELPTKMTYTYGMEIKAVVNNLSEKECTKIFTPVLKRDNQIVATGSDLTFDVAGNSTQTVDWRTYLQNSVDAGTYQVAIINRYGKQVSNELTLEVELPTAGIEDLNVDDNAEIVKTEVFNINGQFVLTYENAQEANLQPGMYVLRHTMADGSTKTEKVMRR